MEYSFTIPGRPRPKERPRVRRDGRSYTAPNTAKAEKAIKEMYDGPKFTGPIYITMVFTNDSTQVTLREALWDSPVRADIDNLVKLVLDGLQGVAFDDDKRVVCVEAEKG